MLKIALIIAIILIVAILLYAASRVNTFTVERSIDIKAAPENIFAYINDFHLWQEWTPYDKDPAMKKSYGGSTTGKGATYAWEGNKDVGKGEIAIAESIPPGKVEFDLHMIAPFEGRNRVVFTMQPQGNATHVIWAMDGVNPYLSKIIGLFMDMDKMIGKDFEVGLAKLKVVAERQ